MRRARRTATAALLVVAVLAVSPAPLAAQDDGDEDGVVEAVRPMIFVHGGMGSGQQFEAQALRFASNGFPADHIELFEHDSLAYPGSQAEVWDRLDQAIADLLAATGADQVDLLGHSQGTGLLQGYLSDSPERAAPVARYVNLDGGAGGSVPDTVEALAIWGEGDPTRELPGAVNVTFADQGHTEVVNSPETFVEIHRFLTGADPAVTEVVREPADEIVVSGRVQLFPQNTGAAGATLEIHQIAPVTGARLHDQPVAAWSLDETGAWGPFEADGEAYYELAVVRDTGVHHVYLQRFVRSSRWVRILTSEPDGLADSFWERSDDRSNLVVLRNKEWWGDQGAASDSLVINGQEVLNEATSPRTNRTIGIFVHDDGLDWRSDLTAAVSPAGVSFLTGVDLVLPAETPPGATIGVVARPRLGAGAESVCTPNWASSTDRISIQMNSYHHLLDLDGEPAAGHAAPVCAPAAPAPAPPAAPAEAAPAFTG